MPRPKTPLLSQQRILDAALAVVDEVGADKFSIHEVARQLGVRPPSIYYYFADRDVLLASVCLQVLQDDFTAVPDGAWRELAAAIGDLN